MNIDSLMIWFELEPNWNRTDQELELNWVNDLTVQKTKHKSIFDDSISNKLTNFKRSNVALNDNRKDILK